jgi:hypothetical protein
MKRKRSRKPILLAGAIAVIGVSYAMCRDTINDHITEVKSAMADPVICPTLSYDMLQTGMTQCGPQLSEQVVTAYQSNPAVYKSLVGACNEMQTIEYKALAAKHIATTTPNGFADPDSLELRVAVIDGVGKVAVMYNKETGSQGFVREKTIFGEPVLELGYNKKAEEKLGSADIFKKGFEQVYDQAKDKANDFLKPAN